MADKRANGSNKTGQDRNRARNDRKSNYGDGFEYKTSHRVAGNKNDFQDVSSFSSKQAYESRNNKADSYNCKVPSANRQNRNVKNAKPPMKNAPKNAQRKPKYVPPKKKRSVGKIILTIILVIILLLILAFAFLFFRMKTVNIPSDDYSLGISSSATQDSQVKNIAFYGVDSRDSTNEGRSDAIMVLSVDHRHGKLKLTSLLRDSLVTIEGYGDDKLNHAYAYGGAELSIRTINQNFNLNIDDYVTVNFAEMAKIVDAFGGTQVYVTDEEVPEVNRNLDMYKYDDPNAVVWDADYLTAGGDLLLNGNQAVAYARIRDVGGDDARALRQQAVLKGLISRIGKLTPVNYWKLINDVLPECETSLSPWELVSIAPIAIGGVDFESISVPSPNVEYPEDGYTDSGGWVWVYDLGVASQHIDAFIYEENSAFWGIYEEAVLAERSGV